VEAARKAVHQAESPVALGEWKRAWDPSLVALFVAEREFLPGRCGLDERPVNYPWRTRITFRTSLTAIADRPSRRVGISQGCRAVTGKGECDDSSESTAPARLAIRP
jgi:hypothetical protein